MSTKSLEAGPDSQTELVGSQSGSNGTTRTIAPLSFGAHVRPDGVEFVLFTRHASAVTLLLFAKANGKPTKTIRFDPTSDRFGDRWARFVPGVKPGQLYGYKVDGPFSPAKGHCFNGDLLLIDPYAKALTTNRPNKEQQSWYHNDNPQRPRCVVVDDDFDWEGDVSPRHELADSIIYEVHLKGFTAHLSSGVAHRGTYLGFIEKIPYLKELGVTAVELLPIFEFDKYDYPRQNPVTGELLTNYWGYNTVAFFAPHGAYASGGTVAAQVNEFKTLVKELHKNDIEVILDVVYNHTAEGNHLGPTFSFRGFENSVYYHLEPNSHIYKDFTGCGNTVSANHPVTCTLIVESLRYWVEHMHVDGFRFDLATAMCRDRRGALRPDPAVIEFIAEDPVLRDVKLIAEAWDAAGGYQVGSFPGRRFAEWNGRYRDDVRQFWRGDPGKTGAFATRLTGSSDLYERSGRNPYHSINFITAHDGFTLNDLVSYNHKHNEANGESNRDGENNNNSYNYGIEGPTTHPVVNQFRKRAIKNYLATLFFSQGVPMLVAGDEFCRTQHGNNNAYCQDNEISWIDWSALADHPEIFRFARELIRFRKQHPVLRRTDFFEGIKKKGQAIADIRWLGPDGKPKDWDHDHRTLMCLLDGRAHADVAEQPDDDVLMLFNSGTHAVPFHLPTGDEHSANLGWRLFLDTSYPHPMDVYPNGNGPMLSARTRYPVNQRTMVCFFRRRTGKTSFDEG